MQRNTKSIHNSKVWINSIMPMFLVIIFCRICGCAGCNASQLKLLKKLH